MRQTYHETAWRILCIERARTGRPIWELVDVTTDCAAQWHRTPIEHLMEWATHPSMAAALTDRQLEL